MNRDFKIKGATCDEKFKYLDTVMPRIVKRVNRNIPVVRCSSLVSHYIEFGSNILLKSVLTAGRIVKICFSVDSIINSEDADVLDVRCTILRGSEERSINIRTKKLSYIADVDLDVADGDILGIVANNPTAQYERLAISFLFISDYME